MNPAKIQACYVLCFMFSEEDSNDAAEFTFLSSRYGIWMGKPLLVSEGQAFISRLSVLEENRKKEREGSKESGEDPLKVTLKNTKDVSTTSVTLENWGYGREGIQGKLPSLESFIFRVS